MKKIIGHYRKCDMLTMFGTCSAFIGIAFAFYQHYTISIFMLVICGLCDAFDGTLARKYKYSDEQKVYGAQLDSLSDMTCFGIFPAVLTYMLYSKPVVLIICLFYMLCGLIRLAYFNMLDITKKSKKGTFIGVPITSVSIVLPVVFLIIRFINFDFIGKVFPVVLLILGISYILRVELKKPNVPLIFKKIFNKYVVNLVIIPLFLIVFLDILYKTNIYSISESITMSISGIFNHFLPFLFVYIFIVILILLLNTIFKNTKKVNITLFIVFLILLIINEVKYHIMGIPLELSDVNYLNPDNISMMKTAGESSVGSWVIFSIIKSLLFVILSFIIIILNKNNIINIKKRKIRVVLIVIEVLLLSSYILLLCMKAEFLQNKIFRVNNTQLASYDSNSELYEDFGFFQGFVVNILNQNNCIVNGYTREKADALLNVENTNNKKWDKANVVFILSEAFSDLRNMKSVEFDKDLMSNISSYESRKNIEVLDLLTPAYGGVSVNTEFEILTGGALSFMPISYIPYTQYYNKMDGSNLAPNLIREFNNNGYETIYLTPWGTTSYNSKKVYTFFEADKLKYNLQGSAKGYYYSDQDLMDAIYAELETTSRDNYKFIMAASAENHFPYKAKKFDSYDIKITSSKYNSSDNAAILSYAQGIYDADATLDYLYQKISKLDTPTIIVFFGDHLPYLTDSKGDSIYFKDDYFHTSNESLNYLRKYTTKAVLLSNYNVEFEKLDYIKSSYLGAYIINNMDLEISDYFKFIDKQRKTIPVFNRSTILTNDKAIKIDELDTNSVEYKALYDYQLVQHRSFYDTQD